MTTDLDLERVYRAEYQRLVAVVSLVTGSSPLAEESVQEAFTRAIDRVRRGRSLEHPAGWIVTTALNEARSGRRRRAAERRALDRHAALPSAVSADSALVLGLRSAIRDLATRQQQAVVLYYLVDLDVATVARVLSVSEGTVKSALSRARDRLHALLDDDREVEA